MPQPDTAPPNKRLLIHRLYDLFQPRFRARRLQYLYRSLRIERTTRILDVGGNPFFWNLAGTHGLPVPDVTIVNLYLNRDPLPPGVRWVVGDGTRLPFRDREFDLAFSNSVIEHLGNAETQRKFAGEARRVSRSLFVQTPNRYFPIETHVMCPFIHWLPKAVQGKLLRNFTVWGLVTRPSKAQCQGFLDEVCLLDRQELQGLFPEAVIYAEKWLGIPKSLIAITPPVHSSNS